MLDRSQIVEDTLGSLALETLAPSQPARELLDAWGRGEASDDDLEAAALELLVAHDSYAATRKR